MEFFEVINTRHMYRGTFLNEKVSDEDIRKIIMAGVKAPQAVNECSTSYIVVDKPELIKEIGKLLPMNGTGTAPCIIVVLSEKVITKMGKAYEIENYIAATENIMLAVEALGYSTVWTDGITRNPSINNGVRKILNVPEGKTIRAILPIGKEEEETTQQLKPKFEEVVTYNEF